MSQSAARPRNERQALISALAAVALWSTVATGFKLGLAALTPAQLLFAGSAVSCVFFGMIATHRRAWRRDPRLLGRAAAFGLVNPVCYYLVLFEAYDRLPAHIAQPLNYTWAITLALLAVPLLRQPLPRRALAGILVSYAGVLLLLTRGSLNGLLQVDLPGVGLALLSTLFWASYWLLTARTDISPVTLMATSFAFATPVLAAVCVVGPGLPPLDLTTLTYGAWVGLVEMGVTFLLWQRALRLTANAARIGQLIFLSPFASLLLISSVLGEEVHPTAVLGLGIIVAGLAITTRQGVAVRPD